MIRSPKLDVISSEGPTAVLLRLWTFLSHTCWGNSIDLALRITGREEFASKAFRKYKAYREVLGTWLNNQWNFVSENVGLTLVPQ
jgi:hypothetical protein